MSPFHKIGTFDITAEDDLVRVRSTPQFNLEAVQDYAARMAEVIAQMPARFGVLAEFDNPPIMGPDVEESMRESAKQRAARGMVAVAFVTPDHHGLKIATGQWNRLYGSVGIPFAFFEDVESARVWLRGKIDATSPPSRPEHGASGA